MNASESLIEESIVSIESPPEESSESSEETEKSLSNGNYSIALEEDIQISSSVKDELFNYIDNLIAQANQRLTEIDRQEMDISNYKFMYDGTTVTIKWNGEIHLYKCQNQFSAQDRSYILNYLAQVIDLEAGAGSLSSLDEKEMVGRVFLIRVDSQNETLDGVFFNQNQYGSSYRWDNNYIASDEAVVAAQKVFEEYQSGQLNVPDWLWCQGMNIWGNIYQISFQFPQIAGQSPQYFTEG